MKPLPVFVENEATARFECVFPTCGGICCKNGRPPVEPARRVPLQFHAQASAAACPMAQAVLLQKCETEVITEAGRPLARRGRTRSRAFLPCAAEQTKT